MGFFDTYISVNCRVCNGSILMFETTYNGLVKSGNKFYCLGGHENQYLGEVAQLEKKLADMTMFRDNAVADRDRWKERRDNGVQEEKRMARRIYSLRGVITRMKNKANGK